MMRLNDKSLEALLRGYVLFTVNGRLYFNYKSALAAQEATTGSVAFYGMNVFKGWRGFYLRWCRESEVGDALERKT
jgi:hypothetical protein